MEAPILHVPSLQERRQQPEKPLILELLTEDPEHHFMIYTVQTLRHIALNEPCHAFPMLRDLPQRRVTAPPRTEAMGVRAALRFVVRLQQSAYDVLEHFIGPGRQPEGA
jgi:hypothetical protein